MRFVMAQKLNSTGSDTTVVLTLLTTAIGKWTKFVNLSVSLYECDENESDWSDETTVLYS